MGGEFLKARHTRLGFSLTAFGVLAHPLQFFLDRFLTGRLAGLFLLESIVLLFEPGAVVAFPGNAVAAVELENPLGGVV